ncbi:serine/threonine-protein kinase [Herbidospora sp. RD11066]
MQSRLLAERYELISPLGRGTMGTVWRAVDRTLGRDVAVKEIRQDPGLTQEQRTELRERMIREGRAAARVHHPSVATIFDAIEVGGVPWIIMELVEGRSLEQVVEDDGPLPPRLVAEIGADLLGALRTAHASDILHRDVKPSNVLITHSGRVVLTDFGIAKSRGDSALTQTGMVIGSPGYTAPERARGDYTGPESDLWSLGATLYFAVEARPAYERRSIAETLAALMTEVCDPPRNAGPLRPVLEAMLEKDHTKRITADRASVLLRAVADTPTMTQFPKGPGTGRPTGGAFAPDAISPYRDPGPDPSVDRPFGAPRPVLGSTHNEQDPNRTTTPVPSPGANPEISGRGSTAGAGRSGAPGAEHGSATVAGPGRAPESGHGGPGARPDAGAVGSDGEISGRGAGGPRPGAGGRGAGNVYPKASGAEGIGAAAGTGGDSGHEISGQEAGGARPGAGVGGANADISGSGAGSRASGAGGARGGVGDLPGDVHPTWAGPDISGSGFVSSRPDTGSPASGAGLAGGPGSASGPGSAGGPGLAGGPGSAGREGSAFRSGSAEARPEASAEARPGADAEISGPGTGPDAHGRGPGGTSGSEGFEDPDATRFGRPSVPGDQTVVVVRPDAGNPGVPADDVTVVQGQLPGRRVYPPDPGARRNEIDSDATPASALPLPPHPQHPPQQQWAPPPAGPPQGQGGYPPHPPAPNQPGFPPQGYPMQGYQGDPNATQAVPRGLGTDIFSMQSAAPPPAGKPRGKGRLVLLLALAFIATVALALVAVSAFGANSAPKTPTAGRIIPPSPTSATYPPEAPAPAPAKGLKRQQGEGFSIDVPAGFTRTEKGTQVTFSAKGKASVRVAKVELTGDLLKSIEAAEAKQPYEGYALIRIAPLEVSPYTGADTAEWEYAYEGKDGLVHVLARWVDVPNGGAFAIYYSVPEADWVKAKKQKDAVFASVRFQRDPS